MAAFICFAALFSCSGAIILSLLDTMNQVGLVRQAAAAGFASKIAAEVCDWTATSRVFSSLLKS